MSWVDFTNHWIKPWDITIVKLIAVPLVFASLIKGVSSYLKVIFKLSRIGGKTIGIYLMSTIIAVTGLLLVNVVQPKKGGGGGGKIVFRRKKKTKLIRFKNRRENYLRKCQGRGPLQFVVDIVPSNLFRLRETTICYK